MALLATPPSLGSFRSASTQPTQTFDVPANERGLPGVSPSFELALASGRGIARAVFLHVYESNGAALAGEVGCGSGFVRLQAYRESFGMADVERAVHTLEDVDEEHLRLVGRRRDLLRSEEPFGSLRSLRAFDSRWSGLP